MKKLLFSMVYKLVEWIAHIPWLGKKIYSLSNIYNDVYRSYSYDFNKNGESKLIEALPKILTRATPVIFDVGANKGDWSLLVKKSLPASQIHCFELSPLTHKSLTRNLQGVEGVFLNQIGLSDQSGESVFRDYGENNGGNTLIQDPCYTHSGEVRQTPSTLTTGENYMLDKSVSYIDFLKIDVEGWEYFVLKGFGHFLTPQTVSIIQFEYGYTHGDVHTLMKDFYGLLTAQGYVLGRLTPAGVHFQAFKYDLNDFKSGPNFIACKPDMVSALSRFSV
jgi:FkbM family methyltransferase